MRMNNDVLFFVGFLAANLIFLFLFPYYIGLDAANSLRIPYKFIDVEKFLKRVDRFFISGASCFVFGILLFIYGRGGLAIIFGFMISSTFVIMDYIRIFKGNAINK